MCVWPFTSPYWFLPAQLYFSLFYVLQLWAPFLENTEIYTTRKKIDCCYKTLEPKRKINKRRDVSLAKVH